MIKMFEYFSSEEWWEKKQKYVHKYEKYKNFALKDLKVDYLIRFFKGLYKVLKTWFWVVLDVLVDGVIINYIVWVLPSKAFNIRTVIAWGLLLFVTFKLIDDLVDRFTRGIKLSRSTNVDKH